VGSARRWCVALPGGLVVVAMPLPGRHGGSWSAWVVVVCVHSARIACLERWPGARLDTGNLAISIFSF
jgi:hypothetical protein